MSSGNKYLLLQLFTCIIPMNAELSFSKKHWSSRDFQCMGKLLFSSLISITPAEFYNAPIQILYLRPNVFLEKHHFWFFEDLKQQRFWYHWLSTLHRRFCFYFEFQMLLTDADFVSSTFIRKSKKQLSCTLQKLSPSYTWLNPFLICEKAGKAAWKSSMLLVVMQRAGSSFQTSWILITTELPQKNHYCS